MTTDSGGERGGLASLSLPPWTNESVRLFAGERDPVEMIAASARAMLLTAVDSGWDPPPYDPFALAAALQIPMRAARDGRNDARTVPDDGSPIGVRIEYDPTRPLGRLRFSVAHELIHTLFPDVAESVRHRSRQGAVETFGGPDDWQLELLCNVGAAELLMPAETLQDLRVDALDLRELMRRRKELQVSTEALMRRITTITEIPVTMAALRRDGAGRYVVDYAQTARTGGPSLPRGTVAPDGTLLAQCTAVGFAASGNEMWPPPAGPLSIQAVGLPPYPGQQYPRVAVFAREAGAPEHEPRAVLREHVGSALEPHSPSTAMIVHVVNDAGHAWGGEFGRRLARKYRWASEAFRAWTIADSQNLALGNIHVVEGPVGQPLICSLVAQQGFGPSSEPRLRYPALAVALDAAADVALAKGLQVHAPRIGTGEAGGHWDLVRDQLDRSLVRRGVSVTVYTLSDR